MWGGLLACSSGCLLAFRFLHLSLLLLAFRLPCLLLHFCVSMEPSSSSSRLCWAAKVAGGWRKYAWRKMLFLMETQMYNNRLREGARATRSSGLGILRYPQEREGSGQVARFGMPSMAAVSEHQRVERRCSLYTSRRMTCFIGTFIVWREVRPRSLPLPRT